MLTKWKRTLIVCLTCIFCTVYYKSSDPAQENDSADISIEPRSSEAEVAHRLAERRKSIKAACLAKQYPSQFNCSLTYHHHLFYEYNASICTLAKSGSSTWRTHLRYVNNGPPLTKVILDDPRRDPFFSTCDKALDTLRKRAKIITVRHPLTRLVSCFTAKYKGGHVMDRYNRQKEINYNKNFAGADWEDRFYQFWLPALYNNNLLPSDLHQKLGLTAPLDPNIRYNVTTYDGIYNILKPRINFVQFINHVVITYKQNRPDDHWGRYVTGCSPCDLDYEFITRIETLSEDLDYVFKVLRIPSDPSLSKNQNRKSVEDPYKELSYYRDVPLELRKEIFNYFQDDIEIFGYHLPEGFLGDAVE